MEETVSLKNHAIKWGVILGVISLMITLVVYIIDYSLMAKGSFGFAALALSIGIVVYSGILYRREIGGYMSFKDAFLVTFIVLVLSGLIGTVFNMLLFNVIDPELAVNMKEVMLDNTAATMESFGAPADAIDEAIANMEEQEFYTPAKIATQFGWSLIVFAIIAAIIGLIIKKNEPEMV
ncbi:DUF4199 domain-containing protein [Cytophagales bacterium LB-30]|uniref:DUF4199 domain-containing protein n=1 Tax=Shiella aurantiaca TaxID=3058365 RepID=A0ABT8F9P8_9BACT|nr:DUF4199 domain-containing protein [Shiella aurantiaca]MDN4166974.1 DUF4199 domain-containing protein [Shiella aurantiaca]